MVANPIIKPGTAVKESIHVKDHDCLVCKDEWPDSCSHLAEHRNHHIEECEVICSICEHCMCKHPCINCGDYHELRITT